VGASRQPQQNRCSGTWSSARMIAAEVACGGYGGGGGWHRAVVVCVWRRHAARHRNGTEHGNLDPPTNQGKTITRSVEVEVTKGSGVAAPAPVAVAAGTTNVNAKWEPQHPRL